MRDSHFVEIYLSISFFNMFVALLLLKYVRISESQNKFSKILNLKPEPTLGRPVKYITIETI